MVLKLGHLDELQLATLFYTLGTPEAVGVMFLLSHCCLPLQIRFDVKIRVDISIKDVTGSVDHLHREHDLVAVVV